MSNYFKYTSGESFTLNESNYTGFYNVLDGYASTGKLSSINSEYLTPKNTFLANMATTMDNLNVAYFNTPKLNAYHSNTFDIFNKNGLQMFSNVIDNNNLKIYKGLVLDNYDIYTFDPKSNHFYSLTSIENDTLTGKNTVVTTYPFTYSKNWNFLDRIKCGIFLVSSNENFKYLCSTGSVNYTLTGSFSSSTPLTITSIDYTYLTDSPELTYNIFHDVDNKKIIYVKANNIYIYDSSNYDDCDKLFLLDRIKIGSNPIKKYVWGNMKHLFDGLHVVWSHPLKYIENLDNPEFIKFGKNIRTEIFKNNLIILNKYSSDIFNNIDLSDYDIGEILDLDVRDVDDQIIILNKKDDGLYVLSLNLQDLSSTQNEKIESISAEMDWYKIKFSQIDSDIFHISNKKEYQTRHLSYSTYPTGRLELSDLLYFKRYTWGEATELYNTLDMTWGSGSYESNSYNNLLTNEIVKNNKMYMLLHNIGRIYPISQNVTNRYMNNIPLDTIRYSSDLYCTESSVGIYLNSIISNLLKDVLNLFNKAHSKFTIEEYNIYEKDLSDLTLSIENMYMNGNETINVLTFQRIYSAMTELQTKLLPTT